jgi:hypothetical protein
MLQFYYRGVFSFPLGRRLGVRYKQVYWQGGTLGSNNQTYDLRLELPMQDIPEVFPQFQARKKGAFHEYSRIKWFQEY